MPSLILKIESAGGYSCIRTRNCIMSRKIYVEEDGKFVPATVKVIAGEITIISERDREDAEVLAQKIIRIIENSEHISRCIVTGAIIVPRPETIRKSLFVILQIRTASPQPYEVRLHVNHPIPSEATKADVEMIISRHMATRAVDLDAIRKKMEAIGATETKHYVCCTVANTSDGEVYVGNCPSLSGL